MIPIHSNLLAGHLIADRLVADSRVAELGVIEKRRAERQRGADVAVRNYVMEEEELDALMREFADHCERADWKLTEAQEIENFERFLSAMKESLESVGSLSEDRLDEADFTLRSDAEPAHVLRVRCAVVITNEMAQTLLDACVALGADVALMLVSGEGRAVLFSNGDFVREEG